MDYKWNDENKEYARVQRYKIKPKQDKQGADSEILTVTRVEDHHRNGERAMKSYTRGEGKRPRYHEIYLADRQDIILLEIHQRNFKKLTVHKPAERKIIQNYGTVNICLNK